MKHTRTIYAYKAGSTMVYVGNTRDLPDRDWTHRQTSAWWSPTWELEVLSTHTSRHEANDAELALIREHRPMFNIVGNPDYPAWDRRPGSRHEFRDGDLSVRPRKAVAS